MIVIWISGKAVLGKVLELVRGFFETDVEAVADHPVTGLAAGGQEFPVVAQLRKIGLGDAGHTHPDQMVQDFVVALQDAGHPGEAPAPAEVFPVMVAAPATVAAVFAVGTAVRERVSAFQATGFTVFQQVLHTTEDGGFHPDGQGSQEKKHGF